MKEKRYPWNPPWLSWKRSTWAVIHWECCQSRIYNRIIAISHSENSCGAGPQQPKSYREPCTAKSWETHGCVFPFNAKTLQHFNVCPPCFTGTSWNICLHIWNRTRETIILGVLGVLRAFVPPSPQPTCLQLVTKPSPGHSSIPRHLSGDSFAISSQLPDQWYKTSEISLPINSDVSMFGRFLPSNFQLKVTSQLG